MTKRSNWLSEEVRVPRGAALIFIALGTLTAVNWALAALLWILQHLH